MKLPSLWPVVFFAGGILLFSRIGSHAHFSSLVFLLIIFAALAAAYVLLGLDQVWAAMILSAGIWVCLGFAALMLERAAVPPNLAST